ncbi:hypothetical protein RD110_18570 [Rhodoferax koreense]|uniref:Bacteriophage Mu Gp45 N-terminal domain-containing protein n=2 Tax=Rhodoferax koreensis TaxID=1842727 RepID=A0A1P8K452_9BURK|nr:hypothetical protein RD110_18570 [Rhodoferax koreense]
MATRIGNMFVRGKVTAAKATTKMQTLQVQLLDEEAKDRMEHFEPYGFTSHPQAGAEVVAGFFDGDRSHGVVLVVADRRYRLTTLQPGEVALHDDGGSTITLKRGGVIEIAASSAIHLLAPQLSHNGVNIGATHVHGGVQPGGASTGGPA